VGCGSQGESADKQTQPLQKDKAPQTAAAKPSPAAPTHQPATPTSQTAPSAQTAPAPVQQGQFKVPACVGALEEVIRCPHGTEKLTHARPDESEWTVGCWVAGLAPGALAIRHGPMAWFDAKTKSLSRIGVYDHRQSVGRWFHFFPNGQLEYIKDYNAKGELHGAYDECDAQGHLLGISEKANGKPSGTARRWNPDGSLDYAVRFAGGKMNPLSPDELGKLPKPPADICAPKRCDIFETPKAP